MSKGVEFPAGKRAEIIGLRAQGKTMREVEDATGVAWQTIYGWRRKDEQFRQDLDTAVDLYRAYRKDLAKERKDWLDDKLYEIAGIDGDQRQMDALKTLHKAMSEQVQRFEITGEGGGPVAVSHEQRLTLAHLYAFAGTVNGSGISPSGVVSDAGDVLPALEDGRAAAGALPAGPES